MVDLADGHADPVGEVHQDPEGDQGQGDDQGERGGREVLVDQEADHQRGGAEQQQQGEAAAVQPAG